METRPETAQPKQSVERLKITEVTRGKNPARRLWGNYTFEDLKTEGIECNWHIQPETVGLSVHGELRGDVEMECARCLEPYIMPVALDIDERYVFTQYVEAQDKERELQASDFYEELDEEGMLDLKDLAHQFIILESANHTTCERPGCCFV